MHQLTVASNGRLGCTYARLFRSVMTKRKIEPIDTLPSKVANALNASLYKTRFVHSHTTSPNLARHIQEKIQETTTLLCEATLPVHIFW
jgi:hypothetical protein